MENIFDEIRAERNRQDEKWGVQNHDPFIWCSILGEEVGEVNEALLSAHFGTSKMDAYREELVQVASVAVAMIQSLDRNK